jgi:hypothetical protein
MSGGVLLTAALLGSAGLATACGQSGSGAIASLSPGKAASLIPSKSEGITPSAAASASTGVTSPVSAAASPSAQSSAPQTPAAQAPAARTSAPQPSSTVAPAARGSGSSLLWLWILIGVIVLGGAIALIAYSARRRSAAAAAAADWRTRVIDVYAEGQALHDAIWTSAGRSADGAAGPRSSGIESRADNLAQDLYALRESAPDEVQHARIVDVLVALRAVRSAMEAHADLEGRLASFQTALRGLRASADPSSSSPGFAGSV